MAHEHFIVRACTPQRSLGDRFLPTLRLRRIAAVLGGVELASGDGARLAIEGSPPLRILATDGAAETLTKMEIGVGEAKLAALASDCANCEARVGALSYGCYGHVGYPIEAETEAWLVARARRRADDVAVAANGMVKLGLGARCASLRARGRMFFTSSQPSGLRLMTKDDAEPVMTTDMMIELLLFVAPVKLAVAPLVFGLLGLYPDGAGLTKRHRERPANLARGLDFSGLDATTGQQMAIVALVQRMAVALSNGHWMEVDG